MESQVSAACSCADIPHVITGCATGWEMNSELCGWFMSALTSCGTRSCADATATNTKHAKQRSAADCCVRDMTRCFAQLALWGDRHRQRPSVTEVDTCSKGSAYMGNCTATCNLGRRRGITTEEGRWQPPGRRGTSTQNRSRISHHIWLYRPVQRAVQCTPSFTAGPTLRGDASSLSLPTDASSSNANHKLVRAGLVGSRYPLRALMLQAQPGLSRTLRCLVCFVMLHACFIDTARCSSLMRQYV